MTEKLLDVYNGVSTRNSPNTGTSYVNKMQPVIRIVFTAVSLLAVLAVFICNPVGAALVADVQNSPLSDSLLEGEDVSYSFIISGIPTQTKTLQLSTDLIPVSSANLWTIPTEGLTVAGLQNDSLIRLTSESGFPASVIVDVSGKVPFITSVKTVDGVVITKRPSQRSAYHYYHVEALDEQDKLVGGDSTETGTLTILVSDEMDFQSRVNEIDDSKFRNLITVMYSDGLTSQAWDMLEWYETKPAPMPIVVPIIIGIVALIIGFGIGFVIASRRGSGNED